MSTFIKSNVIVDPAAVVANYSIMTNSVIDLNFETNVYYYAGVVYTSVAAIISAGYGNSTGGINRLTLPTLPAAYSIYAKGITGTPAAAYMVSLDDGSDSVPTDNLLALSQAVDSSAGLVLLSNSVSQVDSISEAGLGASGLILSIAARIKTNDIAASFNGLAVKTDTVVTLPVGLVNLVVGDRDDGLRPWSGSLKRIVVIAGELTNQELVALST